MVGELGTSEDEEVGELAVSEVKVGKQQIQVEVEKFLAGRFPRSTKGFSLGQRGLGKECSRPKLWSAFLNSPANSQPLSVKKQGKGLSGVAVSAPGE